MASMKNKAKVVWNSENSIEARGQKWRNQNSNSKFAKVLTVCL